MSVPRASSEQASRRMRATRHRDTTAEMRLRRELHRRGLRYRVDHPVVGPRKRVDIVFTRAKVAVFVDGCFWHSCRDHGTVPKSNRQWWVAKLAANVERDRATDAQLARAGYKVIRVWEHEDPLHVADRIESVVRSRYN